jgi:hypothetical protein
MHGPTVRTGIDSIEFKPGSAETFRHRLGLLYAFTIEIDFFVGTLYSVLGVPFSAPMSEKIYLHSQVSIYHIKPDCNTRKNQ